MSRQVLQIGPKILALPVVHGSADCALEVRRTMLEHSFDCVAVPLPPSFQHDVEMSIERLPVPGVVIQREWPRFRVEWSPEPAEEREFDDDVDEAVSYVPIDPCQAVIAALRIALGERIARAFIDLETSCFEPYSAVLPDPYALKQVRLDRFAAAILPSIPPPAAGQPRARIHHMARRLQQLQEEYRSILLVCSILDWPWIRDAFQLGPAELPENESVVETECYDVDPQTLIFMLGELPFITGLYERARAELDDDRDLSIDGVKELLLSARHAYYAELKGRARRITPQVMGVCLKYIRNLSLIHKRLRPDLFSIVIAAKQVCGDRFAVHVAETARGYASERPSHLARAEFGIDRVRLPDGDIYEAKSRLPGPPMQWRSCQLTRRPETEERRRWQMRWNPLGQCSWPPEDDLIEGFRSRVIARAQQIIGADLVRTEKFTTSVLDGIDIRDTLRNWHTGDIYVRVPPPVKGELDAVVMLFDSPADPREYPWRSTWFAEHDEESTLAFFAADFTQEMVGPGIGLSTYGGALFLYPPVAVMDIWHDPRLDFTETMEERLLSAACLHSRCPQIALLSALPPSAGWRRLAKRFGKKWVHVPLSQFSDSTIQQLRMVHVLNGREVRSYAAHFIRKP